MHMCIKKQTTNRQNKNKGKINVCGFFFLIITLSGREVLATGVGGWVATNYSL